MAPHSSTSTTPSRSSATFGATASKDGTSESKSKDGTSEKRESCWLALRLWNSVAVFILFRLVLFCTAVFKIAYFTAYTYGILAAAFVVYPLSGQHVASFWVLGLFFPYGFLHAKLMHRLGWEQARDHADDSASIVGNLSDRFRADAADAEGESHRQRLERFASFLQHRPAAVVAAKHAGQSDGVADTAL